MKCPECNGEKEVKCSKCHGAGRVSRVGLSIIARSSTVLRTSCSYCCGTGKVICLKCDGTGEIKD